MSTFIYQHLDAWSYLSNFSFLFHLKNHHSKDVDFKFQLRRSSRSNLPSNFVYSCDTEISKSLKESWKDRMGSSSNPNHPQSNKIQQGEVKKMR